MPTTPHQSGPRIRGEGEQGECRRQGSDIVGDGEEDDVGWWKSSDPAVKLVGDGEFEAEVMQSDLPVLVDFVADWCGPCRLVAPVVDWASEEYEGRLKIVKIDHDANPQIIEKYKVYGLPALILFKNGQEVPGSRREGAINKAKFKDYIEPLLETSNVA